VLQFYKDDRQMTVD